MHRTWMIIDLEGALDSGEEDGDEIAQVIRLNMPLYN
jgi:hypothetical protein